MKISILLGAACIGFAATPVLAQSVTTTSPNGTTTTTTTTVEHKPSGAGAGAATGAVAGAVVGGPIGAVIGAAAGAVVGHSVAPPAEVRTYVTSQQVAPASFNGQLAVGKPVSGDVTWLEVPNYPKYRWAYLGSQRVVIDTDTNNVVAIY